MSSLPSEQRREAFRVGMSGRARLQRARGEAAEVDLRDLSVGGARLIGGPRLELGESVTIAIGLREKEVLLPARVVRLDEQGCGVHFEAFAPAVENRISRYLTDEQRRRGRPRS